MLRDHRTRSGVSNTAAQPARTWAAYWHPHGVWCGYRLLRPSRRRAAFAPFFGAHRAMRSITPALPLLTPSPSVHTMFAQTMAQLALRARPAAAAGVRRAPLVVSNACPFGFGAPRSAGVAKAAGTATADTTLLARLGGEPALNATLDKFYAALPIDPRVSKFFANTDLNKLKAHQVRLGCRCGLWR